MSNEKTNIEHLRAIIDEKLFDKDEALEFLEAIEDELKEADDKCSDLEIELNSANDKVKELEDEEWESENTIECGIGKIEYTTDNLQLEILMENLEERIKEHGALKTMRMLQIKLPA